MRGSQREGGRGLLSENSPDARTKKSTRDKRKQNQKQTKPASIPPESRTFSGRVTSLQALSLDTIHQYSHT